MKGTLKATGLTFCIFKNVHIYKDSDAFLYCFSDGSVMDLYLRNIDPSQKYWSILCDGSIFEKKNKGVKKNCLTLNSICKDINIVININLVIQIYTYNREIKKYHFLNLKLCAMHHIERMNADSFKLHGIEMNSR